MSTPEPPSYPGDPKPEGAGDLPSYGSIQPPPGGPEGTPPPPPPPPPPGAPVGPPGPIDFSAPEAIAWGWRKFTENVGPVLIAGLATLGIVLVAGVVGAAITALLGGETPRVGFDTAPGMGMGLAEQTPGWEAIPSQVLQTVVGTAVSAVFAKAALEVADGKPFNLFAAFGKVNFGNVIVLSLIVGAATILGFVLCILPGIVVAFLTYLATYALVDGDGQSPIEAIKSSVRLISSNVANSLLLAVLNILVVIAGAIALCVGLFVALPVTVLATAYAYRAFTGRPVAA
jgi:uncharacterized membrane protein